jgi:hypothetical protein
MGLTMQQRHAIIRELAPRFHASSKKERSQILDEFTRLTGYTRCYAAFVLRSCGRKRLKILDAGTRRVVFVVGHCRPPGAKRHRARRYGTKDFCNALKQLWALSDGLCGKRLVAFIREVLPLLQQQGTLKISEETLRTQLLTVSPATVDRLLAKTKVLARLKGRSATRPGTLLKHHIPVRTFADWNDVRPGFCEVDLVAHDGGASFGDYCQTLNLTDVATGWAEMRALKNKAQIHVFQALQDIRAQLPFPLLGLDSDNGSEFINDQLYRYCIDEKITFTRSRAYHKNDNCFVEQKNFSIIRKTVGYYRYDQPHQLALLSAFYRALRLYINFFQPIMKLKEKVRSGSKLTRRYDTPQTPYHRLLAHPNISDDLKLALTAQYQQLNVLLLKRELNHIQNQLFHSALSSGPPPRPPLPCYPQEGHPWRTSVFGSKCLQRQQQHHSENPVALSDTDKALALHEKNYNTPFPNQIPQPTHE